MYYGTYHQSKSWNVSNSDSVYIVVKYILLCCIERWEWFSYAVVRISKNLAGQTSMIKSTPLWFYPNPWSNWWKLLCWIQQKTLQLSGFESRQLSKIQNGRHKQRSDQRTLAMQPKKYTKKTSASSVTTSLLYVTNIKTISRSKCDRSHIYTNYILSGYTLNPMRALYIHSSPLGYLLLCYIQNRHWVRGFLFFCTCELYFVPFRFL